jgi:hypothetical protein
VLRCIASLDELLLDLPREVVNDAYACYLALIVATGEACADGLKLLEHERYVPYTTRFMRLRERGRVTLAPGLASDEATEQSVASIAAVSEASEAAPQHAQ